MVTKGGGASSENQKQAKTFAKKMAELRGQIGDLRKEVESWDYKGNEYEASELARFCEALKDMHKRLEKIG